MDINKYQEFKYSRSYAKLPKISFLQPIDMRKARNRSGNVHRDTS